MMPPRARHRVDLLLVPTDMNRRPDATAFAALHEDWEATGRLQDSSLIDGGFRRVWLDNPGFVSLYANQQGGFSAHCPTTEQRVTRAFGRAVQGWRDGQPHAMVCPACQNTHRLTDVRLRPDGAFARCAVVFTDVDSIRLGDTVQDMLQSVLGESRIVVRRMS